MPDDRMFHKRLGHSEKIGKLTDFEFIVWGAYVLSSDDFGVMRFSAVTLQADHDRLLKRPQKVVQRALDTVRDVRLIETFEHQGRTHCASHDWQNHQRVKHPRQTINPKPPSAMLETFTPPTRALFLDWPGKTTKKLPEDFRNPSEAFPTLARAGARETLTANASGSEVKDGGVGETVVARAGKFAEWYEDSHQRLVGIGYIAGSGDWQKALELCAKFGDSELRDAALVWFGMDDEFTRKGNRTLAKFASRLTECLQKARQIA
jgi:hypothetical protein